MCLSISLTHIYMTTSFSFRGTCSLAIRFTDKFGWESALAIWVVCIAMTCILRYIDVQYLLPRRLAFAAEIDDAAGNGGVVDVDDGECEGQRDEGIGKPDGSSSSVGKRAVVTTMAVRSARTKDI